jgi:hypothetical protein
MFSDRRARLKWRLYLLRAEAAISSLPRSVRRELIEDLRTHVADLVANGDAASDEIVRLDAALARLGDPKEFLAPLIANAVFGAPRNTLSMMLLTSRAYASRGAIFLLHLIALILSFLAGTIAVLSALGSLLEPRRFGVFRIGEGQYHVGAFGTTQPAGEQLLSFWPALLLALAGAALIVWALRSGRRIAFSLISLSPGPAAAKDGFTS